MTLINGDDINISMLNAFSTDYADRCSRAILEVLLLILYGPSIAAIDIKLKDLR